MRKDTAEAGGRQRMKTREYSPSSPSATWWRFSYVCIRWGGRFGRGMERRGRAWDDGDDDSEEGVSYLYIYTHKHIYIHIDPPPHFNLSRACTDHVAGSDMSITSSFGPGWSSQQSSLSSPSRSSAASIDWRAVVSLGWVVGFLLGD